MTDHVSDRVTLTEALRGGLAQRARAEGFLVYTTGGVDGVAVYTDQRCRVCGHTPCPCCERWCDVLIRTRDEDDEEEIDLCCDGRCSYEATPRFFTADGAPWPDGANAMRGAS